MRLLKYRYREDGRWNSSSGEDCVVQRRAGGKDAGEEGERAASRANLKL